MPRILILCTGNSARSQMAEGLLKSYDPRLEVWSAGTEPAAQVNPNAIRAMEEIGIDIRGQWSKRLDVYRAEPFDAVVTVCDAAREACPVFPGNVERLHAAFDGSPRSPLAHSRRAALVEGGPYPLPSP